MNDGGDIAFVGESECLEETTVMVDENEHVLLVIEGDGGVGVEVGVDQVKDFVSLGERGGKR